MSKRFEVHSHTMYSNIRLLDCINQPIKLINRAIDIGLAGIAITDHECLSSHIEINQYAINLANEYPDFKIALGNEIYLTDVRANGIKYWHTILIAKDKVGHRQLRELSSLAWLNSYFDRGLERVPTLKSELAEIVGKNKGHLIATTACLGGELSANVLAMETARANGNTVVADEIKSDIINFVLFMKNLFEDDFYFEVAPANNRDQIIVNKKIAELSKVFGVKMVIGTDAHYLTKSDRFVHKSFLNSKGGEREVDSFYEFSYLQTEEEIKENLQPSIIDLYDDMCVNSMEIFNKIECYSLLHSQQIPKVNVKDYPLPSSSQGDYFENHYPILSSMLVSDDKVERYWVNECIKKLNELEKNNEAYLSRLEEEADIKRTIGKALDTNMFAYPVTLQHYVDLFWECGSIVGAGRGSSCSGLNHYLLGVTQLDPLEWNLPFWRYLNKERFELGDIDLDLCPSRRPLILDKIKEERGQFFDKNINDITRKNCGCTLIATFGTETTKSAILTACRGYIDENGLSIDNDTAQYLSSLVPQERGFLWSLKDVVYGNPDKERKPVQTFINEVNQYPGLLDIMMGIEGLVNKRSSHASGVILFDEDPYEFGCFMKTPNGEVITQYDLHMCEAAGMTKYDFLVTEVQDKLVQAIKLLQENNEIEPYLSLREVYNKYFHPEVLPIDEGKYWDEIDNVRVLDLFQFDSMVGARAAKKIKPRNMLELADANGLMRLMTSQKGAEQPIDKYVRFKNNIQLWYDEMDSYHLTKEEQKILERYFLNSYGVPPSQEQLMMMLMDKDICSFTLKDANAARKIVGKKQMEKIPALQEQVYKQAKSENLGKYVWDCGIGPQMGYSFSIIHALAYSFIGFQTAYIATKWNPIYWNTGCLIVNSGSLEDDEDEETIVDIYEKEDPDCEYEDLPDRSGKKKKEKTTDYGKVAKAIGAIASKDIKFSLVDINKSKFSFTPDIENNTILFGMKGLNKVGKQVVESIIKNRPYVSFKDFLARCPQNKTIMVSLIKAGAFDNLEEERKAAFELGVDVRYYIMAYYLMRVSELKTKLNLQNLSSLIQKGLIPDEYDFEKRTYFFNKSLKAFKFGNDYTLDGRWLEFYSKYFDLDALNGNRINQKVWEKMYSSVMDRLRDYIKTNQTKLLEDFNFSLFKENWIKYASGNLSAWEMESVMFYYHEHELLKVANHKYGIEDFFSKPEEPEIDYMFRKAGRDIPIYKLYRISGTVLTKLDNKSSVILLTTTGVVTVKFTKEYYANYKKQISEVQEDGTKKVIESGWFKRGNKLVITGFRRGEEFVAKTYSKTVGHQLYKITDIFADGTINLVHDRVKGEEEDE